MSVFLSRIRVIPEGTGVQTPTFLSKPQARTPSFQTKVTPLLSRVEMYAGRVACCPLHAEPRWAQAPTSWEQWVQLHPYNWAQWVRHTQGARPRLTVIFTKWQSLYFVS